MILLLCSGLPWWLRGKKKNPPAKAGDGFKSWVRKIPWKRERLSSPEFLPGETHGQRSLAGYSLWSHKDLDTTEWLNNSNCAEGTMCPWFLGLYGCCNHLGSANQLAILSYPYIQIIFFLNCSTFNNVFPWFKIWEQILISIHRCIQFSFASGSNRAQTGTQLSKMCHELDWVEKSLKACFAEWLLRIWDVLTHNWGAGE